VSTDWFAQLRPSDIDDIAEQLADRTAAKRGGQMTMPTYYEELARYNAERDRGLVHTPEWDAKMAELQRDFDDWAQREADQRRRYLRRKIGRWELT
jgi:hypothetical protein